jgi:hypothetical protein
MEEQIIPQTVQKRLNGWFNAFWFFILCYYIVGVGGVLASAISVGYPNYSKPMGVVSACCIAFLAFMKPEERYRKHVIAWRLLDAKVNSYRYNLINIEQLIEGMALAESTLDQMERDAAAGTPTKKDDIVRSRTTKHAGAGSSGGGFHDTEERDGADSSGGS